MSQGANRAIAAGSKCNPSQDAPWMLRKRRLPNIDMVAMCTVYARISKGAPCKVHRVTYYKLTGGAQYKVHCGAD
eukprot:188166-Pelagomonas_calceolata.AAC.3